MPVNEINSLFTPESIATLAGATGATVIISNGIQKAFDYNPKWLALLIALTISIVVVAMSGGRLSDYFMAVLNGFLVYASAIGANTLSGTDVGKGAQARGGAVEAANVSDRRLFSTRWY